MRRLPRARRRLVKVAVGVISFLEGTTKAQAAWADVLGVSREEIEQLIASKVLRPDDKDNLELTFVGIVVFRNSLLFAKPKFDVIGRFGMRETIRILRDYFSRSGSRRPVVDKLKDPEYGDSEVLREYDALQRLQTWFNDHGLFRREQSLTSNRGRPHWVKTVAKCSPVLIQGSAIYPTVIAEKREGVLNDISALQVGALRKLLERYGLPDPGSAIEHAEQATGSIVESWPIPEDQRAYFERRLAIEQRSVYRTDTLQLFKLLREMLNTRLAGSNPQPQIYGTTAFYSVWEDACRAAMGVERQMEPAVPLGQPVWWTYGEGGKVAYEHRQIPDIVVVREQWHVIADAKYFYPFPASRPGWPDIVKQLYYAESLKVPEAHVRSIFLLPLPGQESPTFLGYSTVEGANRTFAVIEAWGLDPAVVFSTYPKVSTSSAHDLIDGILGQRGRVAEFISQPPAHIGR